MAATVSVLTILALDIGALAYIFNFARRESWPNLPRFAFVAGGLLIYC